MSMTTCKGCGRKTNSATSNHWMSFERDGVTTKNLGEAKESYVAIVDGREVVGCAEGFTGQVIEDDVEDQFLRN